MYWLKLQNSSNMSASSVFCKELPILKSILCQECRLAVLPVDSKANKWSAPRRASAWTGQGLMLMIVCSSSEGEDGDDPTECHAPKSPKFVGICSARRPHDSQWKISTSIPCWCPGTLGEAHDYSWTEARFYINPTLSNDGFHKKAVCASFASIKKTSPPVSLPPINRSYKTMHRHFHKQMCNQTMSYSSETKM